MIAHTNPPDPAPAAVPKPTPGSRETALIQLHREKTRVAWLSVISNASLVTGKLVVGMLIGSVSVLSEAIHSGVDLIAALIALFAVKTSSRPADEGHPYGHGKVENLSGAIEALLIFLAAGWIIYESVEKFRHPQPLERVGWGVGIMLISSVVNFLVSNRLFRVGHQTNSAALLADAWHLRTDVLASAGVMGGLLVVWLGYWLVPQADLRWVDPLAALAVALLILKAAYDVTIQAGRDLLDARLSADEEALIIEHVESFSPTVRGIHRLRTRRSGPHRFVDFHMRVDGNMTVTHTHDISHQIANAIEEHYPGTTVNIHIEPCNRDCYPECQNHCVLSVAEREAIRMGNPPE
jgi:cation diffusion facilitator family transporter